MSAVSAGDLATVAGLGVIAVLHVAVAVVAVRFLRVRLATRWAPYLYAVFIVPVLYVPTTVVLGSLLGAVAGSTVDRGLLVVLLWVLPLSLGVAVDEFWLPRPEEVDLPAETT